MLYWLRSLAIPCKLFSISDISAFFSLKSLVLLFKTLTSTKSSSVGYSISSLFVNLLSSFIKISPFVNFNLYIILNVHI